MARKYSSALRAQQADETRGRILEALAEQLATEEGSFSLPDAAARAGVSLRTLHNHFPDEKVRIEALGRWIDDRIGIAEEMPASPDDVPAYADRLIRAFFRDERLMRAQLASGKATEVRKERRRKREEGLRAAVGSVVPAVRTAENVAAMIAGLISGHMTVTLVDHAGLDRDEARATMVWAARVLMEAARRGDLPGSGPADPDAPGISRAP